MTSSKTKEFRVSFGLSFFFFFNSIKNKCCSTSSHTLMNVRGFLLIQIKLPYMIFTKNCYEYLFVPNFKCEGDFFDRAMYGLYKLGVKKL